MSDRITLIGSGLSGMVQALALAQSGFAVTLIGPAPDTAPDARSTAILSPGIALLRSLSLWDKIAGDSTALVTMELIDGRKHSLFDAHEIDAANFGYNIRNSALKKSLSAALKKNKAVTWHQQIASHFEKTATGWIVTTGNKTIPTDLLIGADGRHSPVRHAANVTTDEKSIDQTAMVGLLRAAKPHFNTTVEWYRRGGPLTFVPVEKDLFAFVWCDTQAAHEARSTMENAAIENELSELTQQRFGGLTLQNNIQLWPIHPFIARHFTAAHTALIGEAAHALPPIGAQGFNASLQDIIALTEILVQGKKIGYPPHDTTLLARYEKTRLPEIRLRAGAMNALNASLLSRHAMPHRLRQLSLGGVQHFSLLKNQLMQIGLSPIRMG